MTLPRFREKDQRVDKSGSYMGNLATRKTLCPNMTYNAGSSVYYPLHHAEGELVQCWDEIHKGPPYRVGGPLFLVRKTCKWTDATAQSLECHGYKYTGALTLNCWDTELDPTSIAYEPSAASYGAEAWNKFRPVKPKSDAAQWIAELRDPPRIPWPWSAAGLRRTVLGFKNLGSQYLNYEYGWKPFVKDLIKMYRTSVKIERHIAYLRKNNNKWLTRGGILKNELNVTSSDVPHISMPALPSYFYSNTTWTCKRTVIERDTVWFKGRSKFYIPGLSVDSAKSVWSSPLLRKMYGLELTPSLAWELLPFSWLQDWVVNVGDVISNFSNSLYDNLVIKYAYVMRHRSKSVIYDETVPIQVSVPPCIGYSFGPNVPSPLNLRAVLTVECKERAHASQYGFGGGGILDEGLTPRQQRILWALGLSRSPV